MEMVTLADLPGVRRPKVRATMVSSVSAFMGVLMTTQKYATGAGDHGAVNVYRDDGNGRTVLSASTGRLGGTHA